VKCLKLFFVFAVAFTCLPGCGESSGNGKAKSPDNDASVRSTPAPNESKIIAPLRDSEFTAGDNIQISIESQRTLDEIDSVGFFADGKIIEVFQNKLEFIWNSADSRVGKIPLRVQVFYADGTMDMMQVQITMKSDVKPVIYTYTVVNSYPHDINAYTQGLVYDDGFLYESTGQYGESSLRKVKTETGEVIRNIALDRELFGEGLCLFEDRLYQITWKNKVGFVYDKESMRVLNKIYYQTEGWGLTTDGEKMIMSDGSQFIYFLDPVYFSETGRIEVYDEKGPVANLNELEMIDGKVYANIFGTDEIVIFIPATGKVYGYIDLSGILPARYHHRRLDVLNGIAYDSDNDRLFVTGKYWPRLFEIRIRPK
jgi:glutaminyl-peptide cyclotransferase